MKNGKAPGLDGLPPEFWKLSKIKKHLHLFCNKTYPENRPKEWGLSRITAIPKKENLTIPDNYRGISLSEIASKIYNRCLLNRIRPIIDTALRPNQNGFRQGRSTTLHLLGMTRRFVSAKRLIRYFSNSSKLVEHRAQSPVREVKMSAVWPSITEGFPTAKFTSYCI